MNVIEKQGFFIASSPQCHRIKLHKYLAYSIAFFKKTWHITKDFCPATITNKIRNFSGRTEITISQWSLISLGPLKLIFRIKPDILGLCPSFLSLSLCVCVAVLKIRSLRETTTNFALASYTLKTSFKVLPYSAHFQVHNCILRLYQNKFTWFNYQKTPYFCCTAHCCSSSFHPVFRSLF